MFNGRQLRSTRYRLTKSEARTTPVSRCRRMCNNGRNAPSPSPLTDHSLHAITSALAKGRVDRVTREIGRNLRIQVSQVLLLMSVGGEGGDFEGGGVRRGGGGEGGGSSFPSVPWIFWEFWGRGGRGRRRGEEGERAEGKLHLRPCHGLVGRACGQLTPNVEFLVAWWFSDVGFH